MIINWIKKLFGVETETAPVNEKEPYDPTKDEKWLAIYDMLKPLNGKEYTINQPFLSTVFEVKAVIWFWENQTVSIGHDRWNIVDYGETDDMIRINIEREVPCYNSWRSGYRDTLSPFEPCGVDYLYVPRYSTVEKAFIQVEKIQKSS